MGLLDGLMGHGGEVDPRDLAKRLDGVLIEGEQVSLAFKIIRDFFVFTQYRMILVDIQGMTGSKVDFTTIPYRAITRFSVETAGHLRSRQRAEDLAVGKRPADRQDASEGKRRARDPAGAGTGAGAIASI